ncbi:hypothetical protein AAMO2058_000482700, partial [Amorphochlora amoebiformis]
MAVRAPGARSAAYCRFRLIMALTRRRREGGAGREGQYTSNSIRGVRAGSMIEEQFHCSPVCGLVIFYGILNGGLVILYGNWLGWVHMPDNHDDSESLEDFIKSVASRKLPPSSIPSRIIKKAPRHENTFSDTPPLDGDNQ